MKKQLKIIGSIITFFVLLSFGLYFYTFNGALSTDPAVWGSFGSYFSGVVLPVLTLLNIYVIIFLAQQTSKADYERMTSSKELQQKIVYTQFRQSEITNLSNIIDASIAGMSEFTLNGQNIDKVILQIDSRLVDVQVKLDSFINQKYHLFPFKEDIELTLKFQELHGKLTELKSFFSNTLNVQNNGSLEKQVSSETSILDFLMLKNEIISKLQMHTLKELN